MANTCDYCHKPLSLMRRLRGEQFCSVEHLDLYAAQQAEFALERLAASVTDKPNTERPPALVRSAAGKAVATEEAEQPVPQARTPKRAVRIAVEPGISPEPDYPMAPHLGHNGIAPREYEAEPRRPQSFSPVVTWGRVTPTWAMPQFRSEPGDPRTWTAGKLVSQVPPAAGLRGLFEAKASEVGADDIDPSLDPAGAFPTQLPGWSARTPQGLLSAYPALRREIELQAGSGVGTSLDPAMLEGTAGIVLQEFPTRFTNYLDSHPAANTPLKARSSSLPLHTVQGPEFRQESLSTIDLGGPALPALPLALSKQNGIAAAKTVIRLEAPAAATLPETAYALPELAGWSWDPSFIAPPVALPDLPPSTANTGMVHPSPYWEDHAGEVRRPAMQRSGSNFDAFGPAFGWDAAQPRGWTPNLLPKPLEASVAGNSTQWEERTGDVEHPTLRGVEPQFAYFGPAFEPGLLPKPLESSVAGNGAQWEDRTGDIEHPAMGAAEPQFGYSGPAFAWDISKPRAWTPNLLPKPLEPSIAGNGAPWEDGIGDIEHPTMRAAEPRFARSGPAFGWDGSKPWDSETGSVPAAPPQLANHESPRLKEFHARVRTGLEAAPWQTWKDWLALRTDASRITAEPLTPSRSTITAMDVRVQPLVPVPASRLEIAGHVVCDAEPLPGLVPETVATSAAEPPLCGIQFRKLGRPAPSLPSVMAAQPLVPAACAVSVDVEKAGPVRYSPRAIVVVPPPQFEVKTPLLHEEHRFVAQAPNGVWNLPKVRHTGYRSVGPFPKLPIRVPDRYLQTVPPQIHAGFTDIPRKPMQSDRYLAGLPVFEKPNPAGVHPADYFAWPAPKGMKPERILPEREPLPVRPISGSQARRFGPGRVGLQRKRGTADLSPRTGT